MDLTSNLFGTSQWDAGCPSEWVAGKIWLWTELKLWTDEKAMYSYLAQGYF